MNKIVSASGQITSETKGFILLQSLYCYGSGITAGDKVELRQTDQNGTLYALAIASGANGGFGQTYGAKGVEVLNPVFVNIVKAGGGTITVHVQWD